MLWISTEVLVTMQMALMSLNMTTVQPAVQQHRCLPTSWRKDEEASKRTHLVDVVLLRILRCSVNLSLSSYKCKGCVRDLILNDILPQAKFLTVK